MKNSLALATIIIRTELHQRRLYLLWWSLGIITMVALTILAYASVRDQAAELNKAFGNLSSSIGSFVGTTDMFSPVGYLNSQLYFITLPILFILLSITLAGGLLRREESNHTLELLLARPISRTGYLLAKAVAGFVVLAVLAVITTLAVLICCRLVDITISPAALVLTTLAMIVFSGAFGALTFMLYAASSLTRSLAITVAVLMSFGGYILTSLAGMTKSLAWAAKIFPYHYYDPGAMLNGKLSGSLVIYIGAVYLISIAVAILGFRRRDIS